MAEDRITRLESHVTDLKVANAGLAASVEHLASSVRSLVATVDVLRDTINQGRGAVWVIVGVSGTIGAMIAMGVAKLVGWVDK
jgi:outer membrane murein-binding lipoprotein Lpp